MPPLPARFAATILAFAPLFVQRSWRYAQVLLIGATLTPGRRTVASLLQMVSGTSRCSMLDASSPCRHAAGCQGATSCWSATAASRPSRSSMPYAQTGVWGGVTAITRLRLDAALYEPAPPRPPGTIGRPRTKGTRLPTLAHVLADPRTCWQAAVVPGWYGAGERTVEIASATAVWRHGGLPVVPIRWVLIRDPQRRFQPQALLCTDLARNLVQIVSWFVRRWSVEVTFQETRAHLGVETQRQWLDRAIARITPCLLAQFSIVALLATRLSARAATDRDDGTVRQTTTDLRRRSCSGTPRIVAPAGFGDVLTQRPRKETTLHLASPLGLRSLPRRITGQSRA